MLFLLLCLLIKFVNRVDVHVENVLEMPDLTAKPIKGKLVEVWVNVIHPSHISNGLQSYLVLCSVVG